MNAIYAAILPCPCCGKQPQEQPFQYDADDWGHKAEMGVVKCTECGLKMETCCGQAAAVERWNERIVA